MQVISHPRTLARIAGAFYLGIIVFAAIGYVFIRPQVIVSTDMMRTAANLQAHGEFYRLGFASVIVADVCNLPVGLIFYELFKVVSPRLARALLVFIAVSTTIEVVNLYFYISPLFTFTLPEYRSGFDAAALAALARGSGKLFALGFGMSLAFFAVYCVLTGWLIIRSRFVPKVLGALMIVAGVVYEAHAFAVFLTLPEPPYILFVGFIAEASLALWLLIMGVNEPGWRIQAASSDVRLPLPEELAGSGALTAG
jgi:hypothetical protein